MNLKEKIYEVEFCSYIDEYAENAWDVSLGSDGSVKAWTNKIGDGNYKLFIGADGGINGEYATAGLFSNYTNLVSVNFGEAFHTDYAIDMTDMFKNCRSLVAIDFTGLKTTWVTSMSGMMENCISLRTIIFPDDFSTISVTTMHSMFDCCQKVQKIDISMFVTDNVKDMSTMFYRCLALEELNFKNCTLSDNTNTEKIFAECEKLRSVLADDKIIELSKKRK